VITATYASTSTTATLTTTVTAVAALQALTLATNVATGGVPVTATVALSAPAPDGGATVALSSSSNLVSLPTIAIVAKGATSATFTVGTSPSATSATVTITASYGGVLQSATLTIGTVALWLGGSTPVPGGSLVTATVTLPAPAPDGGAVIGLSSNASDVIVPASVTISPGVTTTNFTVTTIDAPPTNTATITASYAGETQSATLTVLAHPTISSVQCSPGTPSGGGSTQCTGSVSPPSPTGWTLLLGSDNGAASVPPSVTIPVGSTSLQFTVATTAVTASTVATITIYDAASGLTVYRLLVTINP
jgi:hypothetical protein